MSELFRNVPENEIAPNVLLMGMPGSGKTTSLATLLDAGLDVYCVFLEQGHHSLLEAIKDHPRRDRLFYNVILDASPVSKIMDLATIAKKQKNLSNGDIQKQDSVHNEKFTGFYQLIMTIANFKDQHGKEHGDLTELGNGCAFVLDGLTSLNFMIRNYTFGSKAILSQPDYGRVMDQQMEFFRQILFSCRCLFVLISHINRTENQVTGKIEKFPSLIGNKNNDKIGGFFSDVIMAESDKSGFWWRTLASDAQLKTQNMDLKLGSKIKPSFKTLVDNWAKRYDRKES